MVGGRDPKAREGEDGPGDDCGRRSPPHGYRGGFGGADVQREPHGLDPPEPNPMLVLGSLVDTLRMAGLRANPRHVREFRQGRGQIGMGPDDLPDDLSDDEQPRVKIHPPIFKGTPGERPDAHIYAAEDWMEAMRVRRDDFITKFKHTLNHLATEWYHSLDLDQFEGDWNQFTTHFSRYFSTQGRNIKHLHERWRTFAFDPANDDIEEYIKRCQGSS